MKTYEITNQVTTKGDVSLKRVSVFSCVLVRDASVKVSENVCDSPGKMADVFRAYLGDGVDREHFVIALLSARNKVVGLNTVSIGTLSASLVHPRLCGAQHNRGYVVSMVMLRSGRPSSARFY